MLTVDYNRLGLKPGEQLLDLGCGFGRHAYEAARLGAHVVACDLASTELAQVRATFAAMSEAGERYRGTCQTVRGDATRLPFADRVFDRIIASEVLEHVHSDEQALTELARVLRPGGVLAVTVPTWLPEKICWALSDEYHAPRAVGGHVRIYRHGQLRGRLRCAGLTPFSSHHAHGLHSPYWWLRCAVGPNNDNHRLVAAYRRLLEWDIVDQPRITRIADRVLSPVLGKSLVLYSRKSGSSHLKEAKSVAA
ncbi:class I SAM-dependent methyltransferase [Candidatus Poriferisocius sp.]|uniref:class I SAM-dependent methyltransferase n=1 Tax=Candidatus Poriferisocius sp. TaxID=3101276 RepID=UPI003B020E31